MRERDNAFSPLLSLLRHKHAKKYCMVTAGVGISAYLAYSLYREDSYLSHVKRSLKKYTSAVDKGGDILQKVLSDLYEYVVEDEGAREDDESGDTSGVTRLRKDGPERDIPESLKKMAELVRSKEFQVATRSTVRAVVEGLVSVDNAEGEERGVDNPQLGEKSSALDKILGALLSEKGSSLVSIALGMAAKNVVTSYMEATRSTEESRASGLRLDEKLFAFLSNPRGQELAIRCISACADSAMLAYTKETRDINVYDQLLETAVKPDHKNLVLECISLSIRAAVSAWNDYDDDIEGSFVGEDDLIEGLQDLTAVEQVGSGTKGRPSHVNESPVSALRPPMSFISTPTSSTSTPRVAQTHSALRRRRNGPHHSPKRTHPREGFLRALSKEFILVSKDDRGREAMVKVVGSVTREAVGAVANTVAERVDTAYFISVLLFGVFLSVLSNLLLKALY